MRNPRSTPRPSSSLSIVLCLLPLLAEAARGQPFAPPILAGDVAVDLAEVADGLVAPLALTHAGDGSGRLFVVDQIGAIRIISDGGLVETPFLDLSAKMVSLNEGFDERGLLGLAFHPEYAANGRFFVRYSVPREGAPDEPCSDPDGFIVGCHSEVLAEYRVSAEDPDVADPTSEVILYEAAEPEFNHNGGHVAFGPDGYLYFTLGDGGGANDGLDQDPPPHGPIGNGQDIETPLGSVLRIDVDGARPFEAPPDNPFVGTDGLDEIFAYGFRNPFKFSFDRGGSRELFVADVGQGLFEEVNVVEKGANHGWVIREGAHCFDPLDPTVPKESCDAEGLVDPVAEYDHSEGISVIGGYVYRGDAIPGLHGKYVFGDFSRDFGPTGRLLYLDADGDRSKILELDLSSRGGPLGMYVRGFGEDEAGEVYLLASASLGPTGTTGAVLRLVAPPGAGSRVPGDCNSDGTLDLSDAVCLFGNLFLGAPEALPCGNGGPAEPGNSSLLDWQPDGLVDVSDGISALNFLFQDGPPHALSVPGSEVSACVPIAGCSDLPACP
ncbi:MAG: PQQ-dependent sugar dehydrogenase [Candidatus Methanoperedens sp.]|nr:PQQ-dependent sugar dehydrogenase [Candidatus Methanoperedens sp.]